MVRWVVRREFPTKLGDNFLGLVRPFTVPWLVSQDQTYPLRGQACQLVSALNPCDLTHKDFPKQGPDSLAIARATD